MIGEVMEIILPEGYEKVFSERLRKLMNDRHVSQQKLADVIGLKNRQSIAGYCSGRSTPDFNSLVKIAVFFGVPTDYLLGRTNDPTPMPSAVDALGLSPKAVQYLRTLYKYAIDSPDDAHDDRIDLLSHLLEHRLFDDVLRACVNYVELMGTSPDLDFLHSPEHSACADTLRKHGYAISPPKIQAGVIFIREISDKLQAILNQMAKETKESPADTSQAYKAEESSDEDL